MVARRGATTAAALCLALFVSVGTAQSTAVMAQSDVEEGLTCQCGCGLTVAACNHLECSFAVPVRKDIAESLARGETGEQILERYKKEYGEKVLSSPVPEGFNLLAWIAPYAGILMAGSIMFAFFRRRAERAPSKPAAPPDFPRADGDERIARLQREVEELER